MTTASREWQDRHPPTQAALTRGFVRPMWKKWWRMYGTDPRTVLAGPGGDVPTAQEGYKLMRPGMGDTLMCLSGVHESHAPIELLPGMVVRGVSP